MLGHGVDVLSKLPNATIYIEAGASDWEAAERTAKQLRAVGIAKVRGFMLNVTHYDWTAPTSSTGSRSPACGGEHFVINTAENGRGPVHYKKWIDRSRHIWRRITVWCNPGLRGLGPPPRPRPPTRPRSTPTCGSTGPGTRRAASTGRSHGSCRGR